MIVRLFRSGSTSALSSLLPALVFAACSAGGSEAMPAGGGSTPDSGAPEAGDGGGKLLEGAVVARLDLEVPGALSFLLRGTVPLPPGYWDGSPDEVPLAVVDHDGTVVPSQVEVVSRYAAESEGVDVVEVLARVHRDPGTPPGTRTHYDVVESPHAPPVEPLTTLGALTSGPDGLPASVVGFLSDTANLTLRSRDVFGNVYVHRPLAPDTARLRKHGRALAEVTTYGSLLPAPPVGGDQGTLPHLFGVHSYVRTIAEEPVIGLDLRVHNGHDGNLEHTTLDDPIGKAYFESLEVVLPAGWALASAFDDPFFGKPYQEGSSRVYPIVAPLDGGRMHVMPNQAQFHRRLVLAPEESLHRAREIARLEGLGFVRRGVDRDPEALTNRELFSWWNHATARYFPQSFLLPTLGHVGAEDLRDLQAERLAELEGIVSTGASLDDYPVQNGVLGWAHPWGVPYGGMTGGLEIVFYDGLETAAGATRQGVLYSQLVHRMHTSRQVAALYHANGSPSSVQDWLVEGGAYGGYVPFNYFLTPKGSNDPFGVQDAPSFQVQYVASHGLKPPYEEKLLEYQPTDFQHFVRYTRSPKVLTWLSNDRLAADDLLMMAEAFHLSFHTYANSAGGGLQESGLRQLMNYVESNPGQGSTVGRGEGWGLDCSVAAFRTADPQWREAHRGWLETIGETVLLGQASCSGFYQSIQTNKGLDGKYYVRQHIEHMIVDNALRGLVESVLKNSNVGLGIQLKDALTLSYYGGISPLAWEPGMTGPWSWTAVAPLGGQGTPFCSPLALPGDWHEPWQEKYLLYNTLANAYWRTADPVFLEKAETVLVTTDLLQFLYDEGLENIGNRAALIAVVERLNGLL